MAEKKSKNTGGEPVTIVKGKNEHVVTQRAFERVWSKRGYALKSSGGGGKSQSTDS